MSNRKEYQLIMQLKAELGNDFRNHFSVAGNAVKDLQNDISKFKKQQSELDKSLKLGEIDTDTFTAKSAVITAEIDRLSQRQKELATLENWQRKNSEALKAAGADFAKTTAVVAAAGAAFYKGFIEPAADYESEMSNLAAITGATKDELQQMADGIPRMRGG